jgi:hypothetical protein
MNKTDGHDLTIIFIGCYFVYITHKNVPNISKLFYFYLFVIYLTVRNAWMIYFIE